MTEEYIEYLNSDAWKIRRNKRLAVARFRCGACGSKNSVQVHHLTYERIFNENMEDLLPLCEHHHQIAESLVKKGQLDRRGDVLFLATETVRLVLSNEAYHIPKEYVEPEKIEVENITGIKASNEIQEKLLKDPSFLEILRFGRKPFKRAVRSRFFKYDNFCTLSANCFAIYKRKEELGNPKPEKKKSKNKTLFNRLMTERGGFTKQTLESLGESWPPIKGWKKRILKNVSDSAINQSAAP